MGAKTVFILLTVVAVLFFVMLGFGARRNNSQALPSGDEDRKEFAAKNPPPQWIGSLMGPFIPKLTLKNDTFRFGALPTAETLPEGKSQFRRATLAVTAGCLSESNCSNVTIEYRSTDGEGQNLGLASQPWQPDKDHPKEASLVILQKGGTLTFRCLVIPACTAVLR